MLMIAKLALGYISSNDFNLSGPKAFHSASKANRLIPHADQSPDEMAQCYHRENTQF
jgi:hypothetical protein